MADDLKRLRSEIEETNLALLELLNRRARIVLEIQRFKTEHDIPAFLPQREQEMLAELMRRNTGPFSNRTIHQLFSEIIGASAELIDLGREVVALPRAEPMIVRVGGEMIGGEQPIMIAGPCAVESEAQMETVAGFLAGLGVRFLRGGAFKPRSSPYSFQGLGSRGLQILADSARRHGLLAVTEVMDPRAVEEAADSADMLQIGARNMYNYDLLREVGRCRRPVLLKRGFSATLDELLWSAEYIISEGNEEVVLCERGIRTFESQTRNTLDISAVPLLQLRSRHPVIVDVSHAAGRRDILAPLGRAALAAGANGLMVEVHPDPDRARSDSQQQLSPDEFVRFLAEVGFPGTARP